MNTEQSCIYCGSYTIVLDEATEKYICQRCNRHFSFVSQVGTDHPIILPLSALILDGLFVGFLILLGGPVSISGTVLGVVLGIVLVQNIEQVRLFGQRSRFFGQAQTRFEKLFPYLVIVAGVFVLALVSEQSEFTRSVSLISVVCSLVTFLVYYNVIAWKQLRRYLRG